MVSCVRAPPHCIVGGRGLFHLPRPPSTHPRCGEGSACASPGGSPAHAPPRAQPQGPALWTPIPQVWVLWVLWVQWVGWAVGAPCPSTCPSTGHTGWVSRRICLRVLTLPGCFPCPREGGPWGVRGSEDFSEALWQVRGLGCPPGSLLGSGRQPAGTGAPGSVSSGSEDPCPGLAPWSRGPDTALQGAVPAWGPALGRPLLLLPGSEGWNLQGQASSLCPSPARAHGTCPHGSAQSQRARGLCGWQAPLSPLPGLAGWRGAGSAGQRCPPTEQSVVRPGWGAGALRGKPALRAQGPSSPDSRWPPWPCLRGPPGTLRGPSSHSHLHLVCLTRSRPRENPSLSQLRSPAPGPGPSWAAGPERGTGVPWLPGP